MRGILDDGGRRARALLWLAPTLLVLVWATAPLLTGARTLVLRDFLQAHWPLRETLGESLRAGELPLVDAARAGGQALVGNPNAFALYPTNLLLVVGSTLWQLNAHVALHWLAAFAAMFWLAREWGVRFEGAAAAASVYALSGFVVAQTNLANDVAGVALAPALAAAMLAAQAPERRRWALPAAGGLWALELLGGDPLVALLALLAALALALPPSLREARGLPWGALALALVAGTLVAAPQWVETLRTLPTSFRGFSAGKLATQSAAAPSPGTALELLLPFLFGRPDRAPFWGAAAYGGFPPLHFTLAPGLVALALAAVGATVRARGRRTLLALAAIGLVATFAGSGLVRMAAALPGGGLLRFPSKLFLFTTLAIALLAGRGVEAALAEAGAVRRLRRAGLVLAGLLVALGAALAFAPGALGAALLPGDSGAGTEGTIGWHLSSQTTDGAGGWRLTLALQGVVVAGLLAAAWAFGRRPAAAGAALVALHAATQLVLLTPLLVTDEASFYRRPPAVAAELPPGAVVVHGSTHELFGADPRALGSGGEVELSPPVAHARRAWTELAPFAARAAGFPTELDFSPEGLDSFLVQSAARAVGQLPDHERLAVLAATGVERLVLARPLSESASDRVDEMPVSGAREGVKVWALRRALPAVAFVGTLRPAPDLAIAFAAIRDAGFDARREAVVAGELPARSGPNGEISRRRHEASREELELDSAAGGVVVFRRAWLPHWRATLDGAPVSTAVANLTRLAVVVPPGRHTLVVEVERGPFRTALALALLGLLGLALLARPGRAAAR